MDTTYARHTKGATIKEMTDSLLEDLTFLYHTVATEESRQFSHLHALQNGSHIASVIDTKESWVTLHCLPDDQSRWEELITSMASHNLSFHGELLEVSPNTARAYIEGAIVTTQEISKT